MAEHSASLSPQLVAANRRLHQLRGSGCVGGGGAACPELAEGAENATSPTRSWLGSLTTQLTNKTTATAPESAPQVNPRKDVVKLHPSLGLGMLKQEQSAAGRIWLLLRAIDRAGSGSVAIADARALLSAKESAMRVCGWRQLRNLLRQGQGVFWDRDAKRIWLRSVVKVAAALDVTRFDGAPVALPVCALLGSIGDVRAQLYAAFHSGRSVTGRSKPIARATLSTLTGVAESSQRIYEQRCTVVTQFQYAIGPAQDKIEQKDGWQQGNRSFLLTDHQGKYGQRGNSYLAWQLPNTYSKTHRQLTRGNQKRLNQQLADLLNKGTTGNGKPMVERTYFSAVEMMGQRYKVNSTDGYWQPSTDGMWIKQNHQEAR